MNMDHHYARSKLELLLRDLNHYTGEEFWRQMSRIASGATGASHAEGLLAERDTLREKLVTGREMYNGVVERCEAAKLQVAQVGMRLRQYQDERAALAAFANEAFDAAFEGCGLDGAWIQERGAGLGLIEAVEYDPEKHQIDCEIVEPGETIYVRKAWLGTKSKEPAE